VLSYAEIADGDATLPSSTSVPPTPCRSCSRPVRRGCRRAAYSATAITRAAVGRRVRTRSDSDDVIYAPLPLSTAAAGLLVLTAAARDGDTGSFRRRLSARAFMSRAAEVDATVVIAIGAMGWPLLATPQGPSGSRPPRPQHDGRSADARGAGALQGTVRDRAVDRVLRPDRMRPLCVAPRTGKRDSRRMRLSGPGPRRGAARRRPPRGPRRPRRRDLRPAEGALRDVRRLLGSAEATLGAFGGLWYHHRRRGTQAPERTADVRRPQKDALRRRGENVSSIELEVAIRMHEKVADVAVPRRPLPGDRGTTSRRASSSSRARPPSRRSCSPSSETTFRTSRCRATWRCSTSCPATPSTAS